MIDKNKKYKTRDGRDVRIYATDGGGGHLVHGAILCLEKYWMPYEWESDGRICRTVQDTPCDLVEVKPRIQREGWVNIYPSHVAKLHESKEEADSNAGDRRIACVRITIDCEEGEGLQAEL